jgi:hypothetical protein
MIAAGVAAVALAGGTGLAYAASSSATTLRTGSATASASCQSSAKPCPPSPGMFPSGRAGFPLGIAFGLAFGAVHGHLVVAKPGGGYQTVDLQRGKVTAVSASSITLDSPDGFTASYTVASATVVHADRDGIGSVKVGDQVSLLATVSGSAKTAASITDITALMQSHSAFGWH